jgi:hypothetical protein
MASAFAIYLLGISVSVFSLKKSKHYFRLSKYTLALLFVAGAALSAFITIPFSPGTAISAVTDIQADPNNPIGIAKGIFPGRVVWVYDRNATDSTATNKAGDYWIENTDLATVESMLSRGIRNWPGKTTAKAWNDIFVFYNETTAGCRLQAGEKIFIKSI